MMNAMEGEKGKGEVRPAERPEKQLDGPVEIFS